MISSVVFFSNEKGEINNFLNKFYDKNLGVENSLSWIVNFKNPVEIADIVGAYIDNKDLYKINMWICIDKFVYINITENNANEVIKYLYERFPY